LADLIVPNMTVLHLLWDFTMLCELIGTFKGNLTLQNKALAATNTIMNMFYKNDPESIPAACKLADEVFSEKWEEHSAGIYKCEPEQAQVWGIGHCHIDMAWYI
jgi:alpha-mannosidase